MSAPADTPDPTPPPPVHPAAHPGGWRRWAIRGVFESVLIVFSVILALAVTNWAEARRTEARMDEMRGFLVQEIRRNRSTLKDDYWLPHHQRLREGLLQIAMTDPVGIEDGRAARRLLFATGIHVGGTRDTVWRSLEASDLIAEMKPEEVFLLSDIYESQAQLQDTERSMLGGLGPFLQGVETGEGLRGSLISMQMQLTDVVSLENTLLAQYDQALTVLDPDGAGPAAKSAAAKGDGDAAPAAR